MMSCGSPLSFEQIVEYLAGELAEADESQFEAHLYACTQCGRAVEEVAELTSAVRDAVPPAVTTEHLGRLRTSLSIRETHVQAGQGAEARFTPDVDLLVHALHADLRNVHRVDLEVYGENEELFMRVQAVPFDAGAGVVYVACQRHLQGEADVEDTRFRLVAPERGTPRVLGDYVVRHHWRPPA